MSQLKETAINARQLDIQSPSAIVGYGQFGYVDSRGNVSQTPITRNQIEAPSPWIFRRIDGAQAATWKTKLIKLGKLRKGWNGYDAPAPSEAAINAAESFMEILLREDYEPNRLAPSAVGGVGITRRDNDKTIYVEFYNDGKKILVLFSDDIAEPVIKRVEPGYKSFKQLIAEMREYLDG
jgi:hypothetical protein